MMNQNDFETITPENELTYHLMARNLEDPADARAATIFMSAAGYRVAQPANTISHSDPFHQYNESLT
uniref:SFRICE_023355 n=1 Tax=Spodoptera frugiperda TaxID=7108 RepID=A0A2H1VWF8_SPOFR